MRLRPRIAFPSLGFRDHHCCGWKLWHDESRRGVVPEPQEGSMHGKTLGKTLAFITAALFVAAAPQAASASPLIAGALAVETSSPVESVHYYGYGRGYYGYGRGYYGGYGGYYGRGYYGGYGRGYYGYGRGYYGGYRYY
jgi:hypothetical protein